MSLATFDDRVEVWSAGKYPSGITPESLTHAHLSVHRNPSVAEVFYRTGLIEMPIPDKPTSRLQKCRLTANGRASLAARRFR